MKSLVRLLLGIAGLLALAAALMLWIHPELAAPRLGLATTNITGLATIRADIGGFFAVSGVFAVLAAIRGEARYAAAVLALQFFAVSGRIVNVLLSGWNDQLMPPIAIEITVIVICIAAWRTLGEERVQR